MLKAMAAPAQRAALQAKFAIRAETHQAKSVVVRLLVDQHQVGAEMTIAVIGPVASEGVIVVARIEGHISRKQLQNQDEIACQRGTVATFGLSLVVAFESGGAFNLPHSGRP